MKTEEAFEIFRTNFPITDINVQDDFMNYEVGITSGRDLFIVNLANKVIRIFSLPLKAEMIGHPFKHILQITKK